jgi:hypothetical protein
VKSVVELLVLLYSVQRLKISEPLVPPKPKEFDRAMFSLALRE